MFKIRKVSMLRNFPQDNLLHDLGLSEEEEEEEELGGCLRSAKWTCSTIYPTRKPIA